MSQSWNGKSLVDYLGARLWDSSSTFREYIIDWINEIQDDIVSELPIETFKFKLKKLLPTDQEIINLNIEKPSVTAVIASGGSLTDGTVYKVKITFVIYDQDAEDYIESEAGGESAEVTGTSVNKTISLTDISTFSGDASTNPTVIYRRVYVAKKASGESSFGEFLFSQEIQDNTTTTLSITTEPTSTITPPSDSEIDQIAEDHPYFATGNRILVKDGKNRLTRYDANNSSTSTPYAYDYYGVNKIYLYPTLSSSATDAQRTLVYNVYRRPHEVFYDSTRPIDMPIICKKALIQGVIWKAYAYRDRSGFDTQLNQYETFKTQLKRKLKRQKGAPGRVRDVSGDTFGYEV